VRSTIEIRSRSVRTQLNRYSRFELPPIARTPKKMSTAYMTSGPPRWHERGPRLQIREDHPPCSAASMTNKIPFPEGLARDGGSDRPHVNDDGSDVEGVENKCGHELGASCALTVTTTTRQVM